VLYVSRILSLSPSLSYSLSRYLFQTTCFSLSHFLYCLHGRSLTLSLCLSISYTPSFSLFLFLSPSWYTRTRTLFEPPLKGLVCVGTNFVHILSLFSFLSRTHSHLLSLSCSLSFDNTSARTLCEPPLKDLLCAGTDFASTLGPFVTPTLLLLLADLCENMCLCVCMCVYAWVCAFVCA
jgi:hypothetical protein